MERHSSSMKDIWREQDKKADFVDAWPGDVARLDCATLCG